MAVISTSGGLVTLLVGLATFVLGENPEFPAGAIPRMESGIKLLIAAAFFGLLANAPMAYSSVRADELQSLVERKWRNSPGVSGRRVAATRIKTFRRSKRLNNLKAGLLLVGMIAELAGVFQLAQAVGKTV